MCWDRPVVYSRADLRMGGHWDRRAMATIYI